MLRVAFTEFPAQCCAVSRVVAMYGATPCLAFVGVARLLHDRRELCSLEIPIILPFRSINASRVRVCLFIQYQSRRCVSDGIVYCKSSMMIFILLRILYSLVCLYCIVGTIRLVIYRMLILHL